MIIGIDVSKDKLDITVLPGERHCVIQNTKASIRSFMKRQLKSGAEVELVVFEATGGYEKVLHAYMIQTGLPYHKAHPSRVYHFAKGKGYFAKSDRIDSGILWHYGAQDEIQADEDTSEQ